MAENLVARGIIDAVVRTGELASVTARALALLSRRSGCLPPSPPAEPEPRTPARTGCMDLGHAHPPTRPARCPRTAALRHGRRPAAQRHPVWGSRPRAAARPDLLLGHILRADRPGPACPGPAQSPWTRRAAQRPPRHAVVAYAKSLIRAARYESRLALPAGSAVQLAVVLTECRDLRSKWASAMNPNSVHSGGSGALIV